MKIICPVCEVWLVTLTQHQNNYEFYCVNCSNSPLKQELALGESSQEDFLAFDSESPADFLTSLEQF
jgi:hypothetical protein